VQPDVRYCTTADGVRIAYTVTGEGPVFVSAIDSIVSNVGIEWSNPVNRRVLEPESRYFTLVRFDPRGCGMSQRVIPTSLDEQVLDLEAVVERLKLTSFTLHSNLTASPAAITYAARNPDRVSRLVLINGILRAADISASPAFAALVAAARNDWEVATEAIGALAFGPGREESRSHGEYVRACIGPEMLEPPGLETVDVSAEAARLRMPVLVVRHHGLRVITDEMTQDLVARIPDARLVTIEGGWADDVDELIRRIVDFVYEGEEEAPPALSERDRAGIRTVLFTDIVGHTEMMAHLGDAAGRGVLREHDRITRETLQAHGGTEVKTMGDGFMASFGSVTAAVDCAIALQRAISGAQGLPSNIHIRVGLNAGEPIQEDGDLFGQTVILASRICAQAGPDEILIPEPVRHLLAGKGHVFADRGEFTPKGFDDAVRVHEVRWRE
jgi:class 3 adenylate cyclase